VVQRVASWYTTTAFKGLCFRDAKRWIKPGTYSDLKRLIVDVLPMCAKRLGVALDTQDFLQGKKALEEPTEDSAQGLAALLEQERKALPTEPSVSAYCRLLIAEYIAYKAEQKDAKEAAAAAAAAEATMSAAAGQEATGEALTATRNAATASRKTRKRVTATE
jgi:hypothetical protein